MPRSIPLASHEIRWFFEGSTNQHQSLKQWFETTNPIPKDSNVGPPVWEGRLDDQPDVYLIVPGSHDIGIKLREGNLQIKGRVSFSGTQVFSGHHQGGVEQWMKWSYSEVPDAYKELFVPSEGSELITFAVQKTRALRKMRLDTITGEPQEVEAGTFIDRGLGFELTELEVAGKAYCSLAFEAFPDDSAMSAAFTQTVEVILSELAEIDLCAADSWSYPAWLNNILPP